MAELNYGDITRAVQDGLHNLRSEVQRLTQQTQGLSDIQRSVQGLQAEVQRMEHLQQQSTNIDHRLLDLVNDVQDLKIRMASLEKLCADISTSLREQAERAEEDIQYRSA